MVLIRTYVHSGHFGAGLVRRYLVMQCTWYWWSVHVQYIPHTRGIKFRLSKPLHGRRFYTTQRTACSPNLGALVHGCHVHRAVNACRMATTLRSSCHATRNTQLKTRHCYTASLFTYICPTGHSNKWRSSRLHLQEFHCWEETACICGKNSQKFLCLAAFRIMHYALPRTDVVTPQRHRLPLFQFRAVRQLDRPSRTRRARMFFACSCSHGCSKQKCDVAKKHNTNGFFYFILYMAAVLRHLRLHMLVRFPGITTKRDRYVEHIISIHAWPPRRNTTMPANRFLLYFYSPKYCPVNNRYNWVDVSEFALLWIDSFWTYEPWDSTLAGFPHKENTHGTRAGFLKH
jgi:hypothetical protein